MTMRPGRGGADPPKTKAMRAAEERLGKPIERAIVEAINEAGSVDGASKILGLPISTTRVWCWRLGIRFSLAAAMPEERAS